MGIITLLLNSIILFIVSNAYIINDTYNITIPIVITILFVILLSIFPSLLNKKLLDKKLYIVRDGYRLLIIFLVNIILDTILYLNIILRYVIDTKALFMNVPIFGNTVSNFEQKLSKYLNVQYAIALPNCTLSIYTALQVLGIKYGDEVIVPNLTHASSIYPILMSGGKIKVFDFYSIVFGFCLIGFMW